MAQATVVGRACRLSEAVTAELSSSFNTRFFSAAELAEGAVPPALAGSTVVVLPELRGRHAPYPDLEAAARLLRQVAAASPAHVVLLSSAAIYLPRHDHPGLAGEPAALPPPRSPTAAGWAAYEALADELLAAATLTVLRPVTVLAADAPELLARQLRGRLAVASAGFDPMVQFLAVDDLAAAVRLAVERRLGGHFHLAPAGAVRWRRALRLAGTWRLPLPHTWRRLARAAGSSLGLTGHPAAAEEQRYPATLDASRAAAELGWRARLGSTEAILAASGRPALATAAYAEDPFGLDPRAIARYQKTLCRFLRRLWWRIDVQGEEHIPRTGRAVLTGVHRGFMPYDGVMALDIVEQATGRVPRFLIHPCLAKPPHLSRFMSQLGGMIACQENAAWVLDRDEILGFFPEGIRGAFTYYRHAYRLGKLGRDEFVKAALRHRAPIVPFVTVGSAEIFPILGKVRWSWWECLTEWPCFPLAPPFPLLPVPLPSKWHTRFLPPIAVQERFGPEAAEDPAIVAALSQEVRVAIEAALADMLARRRRIFWGSLAAQAAEGPTLEEREAGRAKRREATP